MPKKKPPLQLLQEESALDIYDSHHCGATAEQHSRFKGGSLEYWRLVFAKQAIHIHTVHLTALQARQSVRLRDAPLVKGENKSHRALRKYYSGKILQHTTQLRLLGVCEENAAQWESFFLSHLAWPPARRITHFPNRS